MNPKVDRYISNAKTWQEEFKALRAIILECGLTEELKWGQPCYTCDGSNLLIIQGFKAYCALMFCKGALLKDKDKILIQQTKNVQAARQLRFTNVEEIVAMTPILKAYIREAIAAQKAGLKVEFKTTPELPPEELERKFAETPKLKMAFEALTPGRQRAYILYFSAPKQSRTRESRIEKCRERILNRKGLNDQ
jgi:uncharacterized protein YdeI (YjbR/CyaY-like superfamily)